MATKMTEEEIARQVDAIGSASAMLILHSILDGLYGPESDVDWGADTLDAIARTLDGYGLGPDHA